MNVLNKLEKYLTNKKTEINNTLYKETKENFIRVLKGIDNHLKSLENDSSPDNFSWEVIKRINNDLKNIKRYL